LRTVAIVQARMGSTRLPGKVLMDIGGETTLCRVVRRLSRSKLIAEVAIATTESPADDAIVSEAKRLGVRCFRGSEQDVLARYLGAAEEFEADVVVRITSDCPLIDAGMTDDVLEKFFREQADFAFNAVPDRLPRGLDVEVFSRKALGQATRLANDAYQREHVTPIFYERRDLFQVAALASEEDFSRYRWTLDTVQDLRLIRAIYAHFSNRDDFGWREIAALMLRSPEIATLNSDVVQKMMYEVAQPSS
jgi:spore coat polysaccharide biosynthesis protein SpsF